jgi:DNA repair photolyase
MRRPDQPSLFPDVNAPSLRDVAEAVKQAGIEGLDGAVRRADSARYQEVHVRSALAEVRGMGFKWALNPYRGCTHACEYCYARKYQRHLELGTGDDFSTFILVKRNLPAVLARELRRASWTRESVAVGTATDPYQPIEGHYRITRQCLEILVESGTPFSIVTKGPMILRDADVLVRATRGAGCEIYMSVPTVDEAAWASLEPGTAPPVQRLRALAAIAAQGVETGVLMMPLVPGISTSASAISRTVEAIRGHGLRIAGANVARLDPGVREHFFGFLERDYPALVEGYTRLYTGKEAARDYVKAVKARVSEAKRAASV